MKKNDDKNTALKAIINVAAICFIFIMLVATVKLCFGLLTGRW